MDSSVEKNLFQAIVSSNQDDISEFLLKGANPNKIISQGKTCLGEAASIGDVRVVKQILDFISCPDKQSTGTHRKKYFKPHKRKIKHEEHSASAVKYKNLNERSRDICGSGSSENETSDNNQGYFVFIHSEGSSSDESKIPSLKSPLSSVSPTSPQDLEWDEEINNVAPPTTEDETWSSMYKWYAAILETTGAAIASATVTTNGINHQDTFMRTALHYACEPGHVGVVKLLLDAGSKVDLEASDGLTPLHISVIKNHVEIVKMLVNAGSNVNNKTHEKMTPLHFAASRGFMDLVKLLVSKGSYIEARDTSERTALYLAASRGHADVVSYLISVGANVNGEEIHGYTPLCEAVWHKYTDVVEKLLSSGARVTHSHKLLQYAIIQRQERMVKMLATNGGGINLHNDNGDTSLLLAARLSQPTVARILLNEGANVNARNNITGANVLHMAVENIDCSADFEELLIYLLEYNVDMNSVALTGDTALNRALLLHKDYAATLLIRYGADVNACDVQRCGLDNLSIASRMRANTLARMLVLAGHAPPPLDDAAPQPGSPVTTAAWLHHYTRTPLALTHLCRITIRNTGKHKILFKYISSLPLPKSLKRYLMMEDEGLE